MDCRAPFECAWIGLDGSVCFCCYQRMLGPHLILGNLNLQPLQEILNNPLANAIRAEVKDQILPGVCHACPLYVKAKQAIDFSQKERGKTTAI